MGLSVLGERIPNPRDIGLLRCSVLLSGEGFLEEVG
jgi:hypothetical protein